MEHLKTFQTISKGSISVSDNRCPNCKKKMMLEGSKEFCFHCTEVIQEDKEIGKEAAEWIKNREVNELITFFKEKSLMNKDLEEATLASYQPQNDTQRIALQEAKQYVESFDKSHGLMLQGRPGLGKSHLAASIIKEIINQKHTGLFISLPRLMTELKATYNKGSELSEIQVLSALQTVDLLVLDDLGVERDGKDASNASVWAKQKIYEIVDSRIGQATIYTTNFSAKELLTMYGERDFSRMVQNCKPIIMSGDNYRFKDFR